MNQCQSFPATHRCLAQVLVWVVVLACWILFFPSFVFSDDQKHHDMGSMDHKGMDMQMDHKSAGKTATATGTVKKVDKDKGLARFVVTPDTDSRVTAVGCRTDFVLEHHR